MVEEWKTKIDFDIYTESLTAQHTVTSELSRQLQMKCEFFPSSLSFAFFLYHPNLYKLHGALHLVEVNGKMCKLRALS